GTGGVDGAHSGTGSHRQSDAQRPHRLAVVHRLAARLRYRGGTRGVAQGEDHHAAARAIRRARGHRVRGGGPGAVRFRTGVVAVVASVVLLAGCDWLPGRPEEADRPLRPTEVRDFARLWSENCAGCHGADGELGPATPLANPTYLAW